MTEFLLELAAAVRTAVRPWVLGLRGSDIVSESAHGDATFGIDAEAERAVAAFIEQSGRALVVYSESTGLQRYGGEPEAMLIVDPLDGTRNAVCGFEGCMVSVAAAPARDDATLGDVTHAVLLDILHEHAFVARPGDGVDAWNAGERMRLPPAAEVPRERWRWSLNFPARPAALLVAVMGDLIDATSLTGSFQVCNSTTFMLSRLVTGQLHVHADIADRIYTDYPESASRFRRAGDTHLTGSQPHDLAACALIVQEHGGRVTDAWGRSLADTPLLATGSQAMLSTVAAASPAMHDAMLSYIDAHLPRVASLVGERA